MLGSYFYTLQRNLLTLEAVAFAAAGAVGSLVAETVADVITPTGGIAWKPVSARPSETRIIATQAAARIVAGAVAMLAGMSPDQVQTAIFTATTVVENNFAKAATQAGRSELQRTYQAFSTEEKAAFNTLAQNVTDRYAAYVDSGMSHDEAVAQVRVELQQMIDSEHELVIRPIAAKVAFDGLRNAPALFEAARVTLARLSDIINLARTGIALDQLLEKRSQSGQGTDASATKGAASGQVSSSTGGGGGLPDPEEPEDKPKKSEFKTRDFQKGDKVDLDRFTKRVSQSGQRARREDPKTGDYIESDRGVNTSGIHEGSYWKLRDRFKNPLGTFTKDGKFVREMSKR